MTAKREFLWPYAAGLVAPIAYFFLWSQLSHAPSEESLSNAVEGTLSVAGILVGFLATAKALLFAVPDRRAIQFLKDSGGFEGLVRLLFTDIVLWLMTAVSALILFFAGTDMLLGVKRPLIGFWLYLPMAGLFAFLRSMMSFSSVLRSASRSERGKRSTKAPPPAPEALGAAPGDQP